MTGASEQFLGVKQAELVTQKDKPATASRRLFLKVMGVMLGVLGVRSSIPQTQPDMPPSFTPAPDRSGSTAVAPKNKPEKISTAEFVAAVDPTTVINLDIRRTPLTLADLQEPTVVTFKHAEDMAALQRLYNRRGILKAVTAAIHDFGEAAHDDICVAFSLDPTLAPAFTPEDGNTAVNYIFRPLEVHHEREVSDASPLTELWAKLSPEVIAALEDGTLTGSFSSFSSPAGRNMLFPKATQMPPMWWVRRK